MKITIDNTEEQIDWNKQNILEACNGKLIVITTGKHTEGNFEALCLEIDNFKPQFNILWAKEEFKLFKGTISN